MSKKRFYILAGIVLALVCFIYFAFEYKMEKAYTDYERRQQELLSEEYSRGYDKGHEDGSDTAYAEGYHDGYADCLLEHGIEEDY